MAALTLVPAWTWVIPACFLAAVAFRTKSKRTQLVVAVVWLAFFVLFVEEFRSLTRFHQLDDRRQTGGDGLAAAPSVSKTIRVITINCNVGSAAAARETLSYSPDIVLLQETPNSQSLAVLAKSFSSENATFLHGGDGSILVRGQLTPIHNDAASHFSHPVATSHDGRKLDVVSLRLSSPVFRLDFWAPSFWQDHKSKRQHHRKQIQSIIDHLKKHHATETWIVGGDFNLPGGDGALSPFLGKLQDSFYSSGVGWGNTGTSDYPIFRVDQIWSTKQLKPVVSKAYATSHSDHRMVVVDFFSKP